MFDIILSRLAYVKGRSSCQSHSQGLEGYFGVVADGVFRLLRRVGSSQFHNLLITQLWWVAPTQTPIQFPWPGETRMSEVLKLSLVLLL